MTTRSLPPDIYELSISAEQRLRIQRMIDGWIERAETSPVESRLVAAKI